MRESARKKGISLALAALCLIPAGAAAHKDRKLSLAADGSIPELPAEYRNTRVLIEFDAGGQVTSVAVKSKGQETRVPSCVLQALKSKSGSDVKLSGSWYHQYSDLPHYISIHFRDPNKPSEDRQQSGAQFLFSLVTADLLQVTGDDKLQSRPFNPEKSLKIEDLCR